MWDPDGADYWSAVGADPIEIKSWRGLPARTVSWWRAAGFDAVQAGVWLWGIGHTDAESRRWAASGLTLEQARIQRSRERAQQAR